MFADIEPRHTKIAKVISVTSGKAILEEHARYPVGESNLYFVSEERGTRLVGRTARRRTPTTSGCSLNEDGRSLSAYTTGRHACEIDIKSGKLLSHLEFK